jgi:hypothetical protein
MVININLCRIGGRISRDDINAAGEDGKTLAVRCKHLFSRTYREPFSPIGEPKIKKHTTIRTTPTEFILPRFGLFKLLEEGHPLNIVNTIPDGIDIGDPESVLVMDDNQYQIARWILDNIFNSERVQSGNSGCILKLQAGAGKTFVSLYIASVIGKKTLIVVPRLSLLKQWKDIIKLYLKGWTVGEFHGTKKTDGDIVIAVTNSVALSDTEKFNEFGLTIFDEVHMYAGCGMVQDALVYGQTSRILALSATPLLRPDGFDASAVELCGEIVDAANIENVQLDNIKFSVCVHTYKYSGPPTHIKHITNSFNVVNAHAMARQVAGDPYRMMMIVSIVQQLLQQNHHIYLFSVHRNVCECVAEVVRKYLNIPVTVLFGGAIAKDMEEAKTATVIATTYLFSGTGLSFTDKTAIVFVTPRVANLVQTTRRICRLGGPPPTFQRQIIDIVDIKTSMKNQAYRRKNIYNSEYGDELEYLTTNINYKDIPIDNQLQQMLNIMLE